MHSIPTNQQFYSQEKIEILTLFQTSEEKGLSEKQAKERTTLYGLNQLAQRKRFQLLTEFIQSFLNPLILLLIFASLISALLGETRDFLLILSIIVVSGSVSFYQHSKAEHEAEKLKQRVILSATIIRDGIKKEIPFSHVTTGDILLLSVGDILPADCRLLEAKDMTIDESTLTGESYPANKTAETIRKEKLSLSGQKNMAFMGTHIVSGEGKAIVTAIGTQAEFGKLSRELIEKKPETAFDKSINSFGYMLMKATLLLTLFVFFTNAFLKHEVINSFLFALSLAVGLTPELLPVILTINLAKGATKMGKKEVIVKYLPAIQNLGSMNILCTDKTGTLTENKIELKDYRNYKEEQDKYVLQLAIANSLFHSGFQNPIDVALLALRHEVKEGAFQKIDDIPYDFHRKRLSVIIDDKESKQRLMITKGAAHQMWHLISFYKDGKAIKKITPDKLKILEARHEKLSKEGFRVVVVCSKKIENKKNYDIIDENNFTFEGLVTFFDPPKKGVAETFNYIESLGISIKILTGDNELVARKVCEETDIPVKEIMLGSDVDLLHGTELVKRIEKTSIFARLNPEQKAKIIEVLKNHGYVVGYLGDGINDAPPLRMADVGISVHNGSDIARDIADVILMKKSLAVLKDGILEGRKTYGNILKYIMMETSSNFGNMITVAIASLFLPFLPMLPIQILLNNFLYDISQLTISSDYVDEQFIQQPKKWDISFIKKFMIIFGPISSLFDILTFFLLLLVLHASAVLFHTGWFVESLISQTLIIFSIRTRTVPFWKSKPGIMLLASTAVVCALAILMTHAVFATYFSFTPLPIIFYILLAGIVALYFGIVEITKLWFYR